MQARTLAALATLGLVGLSPLPAAAQASALNLLNMEPIMPGETVFIEAYFRQQLLDTVERVANNPEPPFEPAEDWVITDDFFSFETLQDITFTLTRPNGSPLQGKPSVGPADSGNVFDANWTFELSFAQPGTYTVSLGTTWATGIDYRYETFVGYRSCTSDTECGDWNYQVESTGFTLHNNYADGPQMLQVQVVPEPATTALWLAGLGALGALVQRRRRTTTS